ncbi:hypothetical protein GCM10009745_53080 [Kribbella yunnanensis]|uniref:Uncharacterized protein n=1 Tax=Kribbella yunnanensis TaxID=190194 RepID=A0ABN2I740_9ACTN
MDEREQVSGDVSRRAEPLQSRSEPAGLPPHQAAAIHGQQTAGNDAMSSYFADVALRGRMAAMEHGFELAQMKIPPGLDAKLKVDFKGEFGRNDGSGSTTATLGGPGTKSSSGGGSVALAKGELEQKFGNDVRLKGSLEGSPSGVTPAIEVSGPTGFAGTTLRFEYAPVKMTHDLQKGRKIVLSAAKVTGRFPFDGPVGDFYFKGSVDLSLEASLDPVEGVKQLVKQYGSATRGEALAWAATEAGIFAMLIGGAALAGLDFADEERREKLWDRAYNRAQQVVNAEGVYFNELQGRTVPVNNPVDELAQREAREERARIAKNLALDQELVSCIIRNESESIVPFRWRDAPLDDLIRRMHQQLDEYADANPVRTLWGLRIREDKTRVTRIVDSVREGGGEAQLLPG